MPALSNRASQVFVEIAYMLLPLALMAALFYWSFTPSKEQVRETDSHISICMGALSDIVHLPATFRAAVAVAQINKSVPGVTSCLMNITAGENLYTQYWYDVRDGKSNLRVGRDLLQENR